MHIEIMPVKYKELFEVNELNKDLESGKKIVDSETMRKEVEMARNIQIERFKTDNISYNSQMDNTQLKKYCKLDKSTNQLLETAFKKLALSARAYNKIIKLGRTIADLEGSEDIKQNHIAEAIQYRSLDKMYRGL